MWPDWFLIMFRLFGKDEIYNEFNKVDRIALNVANGICVAVLKDRTGLWLLEKV